MEIKRGISEKLGDDVCVHWAVIRGVSTVEMDDQEIFNLVDMHCWRAGPGEVYKSTPHIVDGEFRTLVYQYVGRNI